MLFWSAVVCLVAVEEVVSYAEMKTTTNTNKAMNKGMKARFGMANSNNTRPKEADLEKELHYHDYQMMKLWKEIASQRSIIADLEMNIVMMGFQNTTNEEVLGVRRNRTKEILRLYHEQKYERDKVMKQLLVVGGPGIQKGNDSDESARLELMGVPELPNEDVLEITHKFGAIIGMADIGGIVGACRINASTKPRPILVQLRSLEQKKAWLMHGKLSRKTVTASALDLMFPDQDVFVINVMSDTIRKHLSLARLVAAQREYRRVWVEKDTIYMQKDVYHRPLEIREGRDFNQFKNDMNDVINNQLEITGVPESKNEDLLGIVRTIADVIGARHQGSIIAAGRFKSTQMKPPRPIIAVLRTRDDHLYWLQRRGTDVNAKIFNKSYSSTKIKWFEFRTLDMALLEAAKKVAESLNYHSVFTRHGRVFLQISKKTNVIEIRSIKDLRKLITSAENKLKNKAMNVSAINHT